MSRAHREKALETRQGFHPPCNRHLKSPGEQRVSGDARRR